jgi:hypothetical protein
MHVKVTQLRAASRLIFDHLEEMGYDTVEVTKDYYWDIMPPERYDPYVNPADQLVLGQLTSDWAELESLLSGETDPLGYGLVWLSAILRAIGDQVMI